MTTEEEESETNKVCTQEGGSESSSTCLICMEEWTIGTEHRLCCLKCGHLFGRSCIEKWIKEKGSNAKCPTCNKPSKKSELRDLWCKTIKANDTTELCNIQKALEVERKARKTDSATIFYLNMRCESLHKDIEKLKNGIIVRDKKISVLEKNLKYYHQRASNNSAPAGEDSLGGTECIDIEDSGTNDDVLVRPQELKGLFHFVESIESSATGGCKTFALCPTSCLILVAQPTSSDPRSIFPRFGLKKYSTIDTNVRESVPLHTKMITSMQVKPIGDLVLTGSQDKKIKITSINNNSCIQEYECPNEPSCVSWSAHRDQQFYVASANCYVSLYDMRNTSEAVYQKSQRVASTRLLSIAATGETGDLNGLLVNDAKGSQFIELSSESSYSFGTIDQSLEHMTCHSLPFEGLMGTVDFHKKSGLSLVTTRRSPINPNCLHNLLKLKRVQEGNEGGELFRTTIDVSRVSTFVGGRSGELLSQSRILKHPTLEDSVLVGACDSEARGVKLWDSSDNTVYQSIRTDQFIRDMIIYNPENSNQHLLYLLSERGINIYRWDYA